MWLFLLRGPYWRIVYSYAGHYEWEPVSPVYMHVGRGRPMLTLRRYGSTLYNTHIFDQEYLRPVDPSPAIDSRLALAIRSRVLTNSRSQVQHA